MIASLKLVYGEERLRPAAAWLLVGDSPEVWLRELISWKTPLIGATLYAVPGEGRRHPCGLLVLGARPADERRSARALEYGLAGSRLYLPVDARLDPPVGDAELNELLGDTPHLWHPAAGLLALEPTLVLHVADLLEAPSFSDATWDRAVPGLAINARLLSIEPETDLSFQQVLEQGREDIGSESPELDALPPAPGEPSANPIAELARRAETGLAQAIFWLTQLAPHTASRRTWINDLQDWAARRKRRAMASLEAVRNREIHRLLELLKTTPDAGLRFALPMADLAHRGLADPSGRLAQHDIDFSLKSLGRSGRADIWNLPAPLQQQLLARYRELAAREMTLGRYRRAAYIFAALLGDLVSAAAALVRGAHWREAAVLYEDRLHQPAEAAKCLREAGLWTEAIAIYSRLGQHETVGDLYQKLDQPEEAAAAWQRAVADHIHNNDWLSAARIVEDKLGDAQGALDILLQGWELHAWRQNLIGPAFLLLARHAWHDRAAGLVIELANQALAAAQCRLIEQFALESQSYPAPEVRHLAADQARVLAASLLETTDELLTRELLGSIGRLAPEDRLLRRDAERFLRQRLRPKPIRHARSEGKLLTEFEAQLPPFDWKAAIAIPGGLVAGGYGDNELIIMRMAWHSHSERHAHRRIKLEAHAVGLPLVFAHDPFDASQLFVNLIAQKQLPQFGNLPAQGPFRDALTIASHRGWSRSSVAMCCGDRDCVYIAAGARDSTLVINAYLSETAQMLGLAQIEMEPLLQNDGLIFPVPMLVRENQILLGVGRSLCIAGSQQGYTTLELASPINTLAASAPHTRTRIAIGMTQGGTVLWGDTIQAPQTPFATELDRPMITLTRNGRLVAADKNTVEVYLARAGRVRLDAVGEHSVGQPVAVLNTSHADQFAIVGTGGRVLVQRIKDHS